MTKIHVTGNAGSGKSTLADSIGRSLGLPVYGLDSIVWMPGWQKTSAEIRQKKEDALTARPDWVIEGVSKSVRDKADLVIFLDIGRGRCLYRCMKRNWRYLFKSRPELPPKCPEILILPRLFKLIWAFPTLVRPNILRDINAPEKQSYLIRSPDDLRLMLDELTVQERPKLEP